ncbi:3-methyladenine DNA glycosylase [Bacterioplanes sanyensis]|uniref:3-methyladenine DNA glycosylase n=1 Tax=Bacterioplanes sanyensis TaxID=1249553 RepID=A0A222FFZ6_9GAMM|nr:Ada metal-binding domain-containing protein [Bacterioplanes sanyensis]ASP37690.1 3-methyladenine DNA glycosylase [Bacterioplanes sanyensis]
MTLEHSSLTLEQCRLARLSRDVRFDGQFYVAVKTTRIFCRPICPARLPKEENVEYYLQPSQALAHGYRPCLRCRPDSAPNSWAWKGVETTFLRALSILHSEPLGSVSVAQLALRLGISERYLRDLFARYLGVAPKKYQLYTQLMFAKHLLHDSSLSVTDVAYSSGFSSIRRFNDAFLQHFSMAPTQLRRSPTVTSTDNRIHLKYQGELAWQTMLDFYRRRLLHGVESVGDHYYQRRVMIHGQPASFSLECVDQQLQLTFDVHDLNQLQPLLANVRRMFDLDANTQVIEQHLSSIHPELVTVTGLRIPGVWNGWEAGVRAIFGQQVSLSAATQLLNQLMELAHPGGDTFPSPTQVLAIDVSALKMPARRQQTLHHFAHYCQQHDQLQESELLALPGIGPWTLNYIKLRGWSEPDCLLENDLIIKKQLSQLGGIEVKQLSPWGSYANLQLWEK